MNTNLFRNRFISVISNPIDIDDDVKKEAIELFVKKSGMYQSMQGFLCITDRC